MRPAFCHIYAMNMQLCDIIEKTNGRLLLKQKKILYFCYQYDNLIG